jgi:hypothetical protein
MVVPAWWHRGHSVSACVGSGLSLILARGLD